MNFIRIRLFTYGLSFSYKIEYHLAYDHGIKSQKG